MSLKEFRLFLVLVLTLALVLLALASNITSPVSASLPLVPRVNGNSLLIPLLMQTYNTEPTPLAFPTNTPVVPCGDGRGCPDLVVDSSQMSDWDVVTRTFSASDCAVIEGYAKPGLDVLLRYTANVPNIGKGSLIIGSPAQDPDLFVWSQCHFHYHLKYYADYRLWTPQGFQTWTALRARYPNLQSQDLLNAYPELQAQMVKTFKFSFCVADDVVASVPNAPPPDEPPKYTSLCSLFDVQGQSRGWADVYPKTTEGQWFEVRDLLPGIYVIEEEINGIHFFVESNYANNSSYYTVTIPNLGIPTRTPSAALASP